MKGLFEGLMFFGIVVGIFIASLAVAIGIVADAKDNREARSISKKMLVGGTMVFALSVVFVVL